MDPIAGGFTKSVAVEMGVEVDGADVFVVKVTNGLLVNIVDFGDKAIDVGTKVVGKRRPVKEMGADTKGPVVTPIVIQIEELSVSY
ncbi:hypothetical protein N7G274_000856 [Stereocaulon virgatum]|uniref:Uncharacterized protein n=1 Tax=Stereocaulon virgatum TaxID=373712 RepID=A0ABR4ATQ9_9LECA